MIVERITDWGEYPLYQARLSGSNNKNVYVFGTSYVQAIGNLLGSIIKF